jgi:hypothetical protein
MLASMPAPVQVSDAEVLALIRELAGEGAPPSGVQLRAELRRRHGVRGGVARIYRLLRAAEEGTRAPPPDLQRELDAARERARLAEFREEAHQLHWAREVDGLRTRLVEAERLAARARALEEQNLELRRRLQSAELRLAAVERRGQGESRPPR